jgi:hypothetical protein
MAEASKNMVTRSSAAAAGRSHAPAVTGYAFELSNISADDVGCRVPAGSSRLDRRQEKFPQVPHQAGDRAGAPSPRPVQKVPAGRTCRRVSWASSFSRGERLAPYRVRGGRGPFLRAEKPHLSVIVLSGFHRDRLKNGDGGSALFRGRALVAGRRRRRAHRAPRIVFFRFLIRDLAHAGFVGPLALPLLIHLHIGF